MKQFQLPMCGIILILYETQRLIAQFDYYIHIALLIQYKDCNTYHCVYFLLDFIEGENIHSILIREKNTWVGIVFYLLI